MPENGSTPPPAEQPQKRAIARPQMYIDVMLADGQKFIFDLSTAEELKNEIDMALKSLAPLELKSSTSENLKES